MKVLVVEDEGITRLWLEDLIGSWGYEVIAAGNGAEALDLLSGIDSPIVVLLDWQLPKLSGIEVCRHLKSDPGHLRRCYVIMLTARTDAEHKSAAEAAGADDFAEKPFEADRLQQQIERGVRALAVQDPPPA